MIDVKYLNEKLQSLGQHNLLVVKVDDPILGTIYELRSYYAGGQNGYSIVTSCISTDQLLNLINYDFGCITGGF